MNDAVMTANYHGIWWSAFEWRS